MQVNAIRIIADTNSQDGLKSPKVESEHRINGHRQSQTLQERQETLPEGRPLIPRASLPYEVIHIKVKDKQIPAVITYDTGAEFSFCNKNAELIANSIENTKRNLMIGTINNVQKEPLQLCKLKLENGQDIQTIILPNMEWKLQPQDIPEQWRSLKGKWANQNTQGVSAHILLGANHATKFPQAVKDASGTLLQANQARLLKSEITGRYIMFGCSNQPSTIKPINLGKNFKSLKFGYKASPTLVSAITRNIGNLHPPVVNKEDLRKKHRKNTQSSNPSNLKQVKDKGTPSPLPSTVSKNHQPKQHKMQQPTDLPDAQSPQDTKSLYKQDKITREDTRTAKGGSTRKSKLGFQH